MHQITEGKAKISIPAAEKISKQMPVFYNPVMKHNRDISILLLNSLDKKDMQIADPLAASGIRAIRFILELDKKIVENISINDNNKNFKKIINNNLKANKIKITNKLIIKNEDANLFLVNSTGFDYIDIDPFGTPNPFLDNAVKRLSREGILAITATDLSSLAGTYPDVCKRRYWAVPMRNELMHEIGLRILIRKIQLIGAQYEKSLIPIFSYFKDHYFRIFFQCSKGKKDVDKIIEEHGFFEGAGPMWLGRLWDKNLVDKIYSNFLRNNNDKELDSFLKTIKEESPINNVGFYDVHKIIKRNKIKKIPKKELLIEKIKGLGYMAAGTHFNVQGIRSDISLEKITNIIKKFK